MPSNGSANILNGGEQMHFADCNKNQFVLSNCHFVLNDNLANPQLNNHNYSNVTIWREELNAKNNVQQQIKKQVHFKTRLWSNNLPQVSLSIHSHPKKIGYGFHAHTQN